MADEQARALVYGTFRIAAEHRRHFIELVRHHFIDTAQSTPGCLFYSLSADITDETLFHLVEGWQDRAALDAHLASERLRLTRAQLAAVTMHDYHTVIYEVNGASRYVPTDLPIT
jgi:quinol monooxygenase YgiN